MHGEDKGREEEMEVREMEVQNMEWEKRGLGMIDTTPRFLTPSQLT